MPNGVAQAILQSDAPRADLTAPAKLNQKTRREGGQGLIDVERITT
jgi:hypothetical protein